MYRFVYLIFISFFIIGCTRGAMSPVNVAGNFWKAYSENRIEDAKKFTIKHQVSFPNLIKIKSFQFGEVKIDKDRATIKTTAILEGFKNSDAKKETKIVFDTKLRMVKNEGWRVDFDETQKLIYLEIAKHFTGDFKDVVFAIIKQGFLGFFDALDDVLKK